MPIECTAMRKEQATAGLDRIYQHEDCGWVCVGKDGGSQKYQQNYPFRK